MERVKKGEKYWFVEVFAFSPFVESCTEINSIGDDNRFNCGNYFHNRKEAELMARKLRAVLKGADVIEMPSAEEIKQYADTAIYNPKDGDRRVHTCEVISYASGIENGIEWLKSKIVK